MAEETTKRVSRSKKVAAAPSEAGETLILADKTPALPTPKPFTDLIQIISEAQANFENLQKEMAEARQVWLKEKAEHDKSVAEKDQQEKLERNREQETYLYNLARQRQKAEDEFADKKAAWEKELRDQQETLKREKEELDNLRKLVSAFDSEKEKAISQATSALQKELSNQFDTDRKLKEQEYKAERDILNLKISTFTAENARLIKEIESLKQALAEGTRQVKEIAVKVIESGSNVTKSSIPQEEINKPRST